MPFGLEKLLGETSRFRDLVAKKRSHQVTETLKIAKKKMKRACSLNANTDEYIRIKRTYHGNSIQGGGTKGHVNLVEKTIFMAWNSTCTFQQISNHIYV